MRFVVHKLNGEDWRIPWRGYVLRVLIGHALFLIGWPVISFLVTGDWLHRWPLGLATAVAGAVVALGWGYMRSTTDDDRDGRTAAKRSADRRHGAIEPIVTISPAVLRCRECRLPITRLVQYLADVTELCEEDGQPVIPSGYYTVADALAFTGTGRQVIVNLQDLLNTKPHPDRARRNGCCGMDGCDGPNTVCGNGHEIGTERSDCWMPHAMYLDPRAVETSAAEA